MLNYIIIYYWLLVSRLTTSLKVAPVFSSLITPVKWKVNVRKLSVTCAKRARRPSSNTIHYVYFLNSTTYDLMFEIADLLNNSVVLTWNGASFKEKTQTRYLFTNVKLLKVSNVALTKCLTNPAKHFDRANCFQTRDHPGVSKTPEYINEIHFR